MEIIEKKLKRNFELNENKTQIILTHSSRSIIPFINSLKHRINGKNQKIPHFLIDREGKIIQLLDELEVPKLFKDDNYNRNGIVICYENLGWLEKEVLKSYHINWIGNIYTNKVTNRKWRDYYLWQPYTEEQINSSVKLCKMISEKHGIKLKMVGHNTKVKGVESFEGIITRSNFDEHSTSVSPAFDFEYFKKKLENE